MQQTGHSPMFAIMVTLMFIWQNVNARRRDPRDTINEYIVMHKAQNLSCQRHNKCISVTQCPHSRGWHLLGEDYGCCGNYKGCCRVAHKICWFHDAFCRCCDFGILVCGPFCRPDEGCGLLEGSGEVHEIDVLK